MALTNLIVVNIEQQCILVHGNIHIRVFSNFMMDYDTGSHLSQNTIVKYYTYILCELAMVYLSKYDHTLRIIDIIEAIRV